jgi:C4-dicarboxylate-specific signal transduction histidine kinase
LTPSLRYLRERKEEIRVRDFLEDLAAFHSSRFNLEQIGISIKTDEGRGFSVLMNKGKLTQIFDNLLLNAEYWLQEALRAGTIKKAEVSLVIDSPVVRVFDNGKGVDPAVEETLFEPFVTRKRSGEGRGLGLFVVQQLLDSESCTVLLLPERNTRERRYLFEIDFSGAMSG